MNIGGILKKETHEKQHTNTHHVYPTSRFTREKPVRKHNAWHQIFENKTPEEAIEQVRSWSARSGQIRKNLFEKHDRKKKAWGILFGQEVFSKQVIRIIEREWTFPGVKMIKT